MKINSTLIAIFTVCLVQISCGQDKLKIERSENYRLIKVLNNSELIGENREDNLSVRIYKIDNGSGSAVISEGHEVSHNLLIAVSEFDEQPLQNLFEIGPFFNPKFIKWTKITQSQKEYEIEYGAFNDRKNLKLIVNINELKNGIKRQQLTTAIIHCGGIFHGKFLPLNNGLVLAEWSWRTIPQRNHSQTVTKY